MKLDVPKQTLAGSEDSSGTFNRVRLSQSELSSVQSTNGKLGESESSRSSRSSFNGNSKGMSQTGNNKAETHESVSSNPDKENTTSNMLNVEGKNGETYTCPLCNQVLPSPHAFTIHIRQHNPSDHSHTCRLCGKTLSSASSLDRHMLVHSGERPFKCRLCSMAFTTNGNMHRHMRTHGEENSGDTTRSPKEGRSKKRKSDVHSGSNGTLAKKKDLDVPEDADKLHCPVCDKTLYGAQNFQIHMELHPDDPIWCKQCCQALANYSVYSEHTCVKFPNKDENNKESTTSIGFQDLTFMDFSTNKFSLVAKSFCENSSRRPSSAFHAFECNKCDKSFPCNSALRLHGMVHSEKKRTFCPTCQCDFLTSASLKAHQLTHRKAEHCNAPENIKSEEIPEEETQKEDFMALLELKNKEDQSVIKKEKLREPAFENMSYFVHGKPELQTQVMSISSQTTSKGESEHSDFADIQSIISVTSKSPLVPSIGASLTVVVEPSTPSTQVVASSPCIPPDSPPAGDSANASPETPSKEDSEQSSQKGSDDPESEDGATCDGSIETDFFSCKVCKLSFKNDNALRRHKRSHSIGNSNSSFSCNMCPYTSLDKSTLIRHLRTHNGERPFQCAICKYAFTTKANCERHVRKRHKKLSKMEIRSAMQYNPNMTDVKAAEVVTPEISASETVCKYCNVDFKFNRVLRHHLRSLHNSCSRKPFFCILCKLGFSTKNNCIRHVLKQHPDKKEKVSEIVSANSPSDMSDQDSILMSDESPQKEVPSDTEQPLNLSVKMSSFSSCNFVSNNDLQSVDDIVSAANSLVSLSEIPPPQDEPLDLAIHPLDLRLRPTSVILDMPTTEPQHKISFNVKHALTPLPVQSPAHPLNPVQTLELTMKSHSPVPTPAPAVHLIPQTPVTTAVEDLSVLSKNSHKEDVYKMTFKIVNDQLSPRNQRSFSCVYCSAGFTLKSNMERHIKRKHPEFARPTRSRNFIPTLTSPARKSSTPALSNKTRDALRVVLSNKAGGQSHTKDDYQSSNDNFDERQSLDFSDSESLIINESEDTPENSLRSNNVPSPEPCAQTTDMTEDPETAPDLASVSSVIDTANSQQFQQYLLDAQDDNKKEEAQNKKEKGKEKTSPEVTEGKRESGSTANTTTKKRSSYTDSPNSVACPFCTRKFPWSSSLRRHILTHTGQKPYKCPRCPIWFTTKSNCERHLVRKHGQNSSEILTRAVPERPYKCNICPSSTFSTQGNLRKHYYLKHLKKTGGRSKALLNLDPEKSSLDKEELLEAGSLGEHINSDGEQDSDPGSLVIASEPPENVTVENDLPYKCHLCDMSYVKRSECLDHLKREHKEDYQLLESKGAMEAQTGEHTQPLEDDVTDPKETDIQRKVVCVLCNRRFWSAEDLRRHMRTHSGERPFTCDICQRKFSLKHSMIRHRRKHHTSSASVENDSTDDECAVNPNPPAKLKSPSKGTSPSKGKAYNGPRSKKKSSQNSLLYLMAQNEGNLQTTWSKSSAKNPSASTSDSKREDDDTDLIQNLLGIHDSKIIDEMLDSADSAARLLGVRAEI